jgi:hypothetical protein
MSDPALSPAQLDLLEDALEDLELGGLPSALLDPHDDDARAVVDTLEVYRSILAMSRQALPTEDVPPGLLDDVLAEARRAAAAPAKVERAVPWYRRLGGWGPALAFAGTAALLVVLVRPTSQDSEAPAIARQESEERKADSAPASAADQTPSEAPAAVPAADADAEAEPQDENELDGLKLADAQGKAEARDAWGDLGGEAAEGRGAGADTTRREKAATKVPAAEAPGSGVVGGTSKSSSSTASADKKAKGAAYDPKPAPKANATPKSPPPQTTGPLPSSGGAPAAEPAKPVAKPEDAEEKKDAPDGWADIATGDAKRRAGACSSAKTAYQRAVEDDSAEVRARALAGLGLCELDAGNTSAAESLFAKAKKTDPKVEKLIAAERARHEPKDEAQADQAAPP